ncbi:MAG: mechanosensitive ion channel family protein [Candidatus Ratteibacteria bacterium]
MHELLLAPTKELINRLGGAISKLLFGLLVFIVGWIVAKVFKILATKFLKMLKIDKLVEDSGFREILLRGQITKEPSELLASVIYWLLLIVVVFLSINVAGIPIPQDVIENLLSFIPKIIIGLILFIAALLVGNIVEGVVNTAAGNAGIQKSYVLGKTAKTVIIIFGVVLALDEMGIGGNFVTSVFNIILASGALAFALAFGLGAKDVVKNWLEEFLTKKQ